MTSSFDAQQIKVQDTSGRVRFRHLFLPFSLEHISFYRVYRSHLVVHFSHSPLFVDVSFFSIVFLWREKKGNSSFFYFFFCTNIIKCHTSLRNGKTHQLFSMWFLKDDSLFYGLFKRSQAKITLSQFSPTSDFNWKQMYGKQIYVCIEPYLQHIYVHMCV